MTHKSTQTSILSYVHCALYHNYDVLLILMTRKYTLTSHFIILCTVSYNVLLILMTHKSTQTSILSYCALYHNYDVLLILMTHKSTQTFHFIILCTASYNALLILMTPKSTQTSHFIILCTVSYNVLLILMTHKSTQTSILSYCALYHIMYCWF